MSKIDEYNKLKLKRNYLANKKWFPDIPVSRVRLFNTEDDSTQEHYPDNEDKNIISQALGYIEYDGANLKYHGNSVLGEKLRKIVLYYLDKKLDQLAKDAEEEAKEILSRLKEEPRN